MKTVDFVMSWDKLSDVLYIILEDVDEDHVNNVDSLKIPGVVKRMSTLTNECVGFIIHDFSIRFPHDAKKPEADIKELLVESMRRTNAANAQAFTAKFEMPQQPAIRPLPVAA